MPFTTSAQNGLGDIRDHHQNHIAARGAQLAPVGLKLLSLMACRTRAVFAFTVSLLLSTRETVATTPGKLSDFLN